MREQIQSRLSELRNELDKGQTELEALERQRVFLRDTLMRITGAIQVLEELLAAESAGPDGTVSGDRGDREAATGAVRRTEA
jgi:prefoldin subunit 5